MTIPRRMAPALAAVLALVTLPAGAKDQAARVIVSSTLNDTLQVFDAGTLEELQTPVLSRGGGSVRLAVAEMLGQTWLFAANHGVQGSVGVFSLEGDEVAEAPVSPFPARLGSVGIDATTVTLPDGSRVPMVFVTNAYQALGGCDLPEGSVTGYVVSQGSVSPLLSEVGTVQTSGAIPYAVSIDGAGARAYASSNCGDTLDTIAVTLDEDPYTPGLALERTAARATGAGPDATVFDGELNYTANISGSSVSVHDASSPAALTTVPLAGARPIDATLAESPSGARWLITSNGGDDTVSLIDRTIVKSCVAAAQATCQAEVARIATAVPGGAPEGVAYDPETNRVFAVNKTFPPTLSVIQLTESDGTVTGADIARIPLTALGAGTPIPAIIAFDVVVQAR